MSKSSLHDIGNRVCVIIAQIRDGYAVGSDLRATIVIDARGIGILTVIASEATCPP
jgi:hypothetical protein